MSYHLLRSSIRRTSGNRLAPQLMAPFSSSTSTSSPSTTGTNHHLVAAVFSSSTYPPQKNKRNFSTSSESPQTSQQQPLLDRTDKSWFARLIEKYSIKQQTNRILVAELLLQAAITQASDPRWYGPGRIPRDYRNYQAVLTMHIWFLHKRLILDTADPHRAALIQEELFDIFWTDTTNRMRAAGVQEMTITKNLKTVQQYTFMHCFHYDHCYTDLLDKPKERLNELKNLVFQHILLIKDDDNEGRLEHDDQATRLAWYIETQYQNIIYDLPNEYWSKARIAWVDLPDFAGLKDSRGKEIGDNPIHDDDILPENWIKNIANDGTYYYWNVKTREAQWEKPEPTTTATATVTTNDDDGNNVKDSSSNYKT